MNILGLMSGTSMDGVDICIANLKIDKDENMIYKIINSYYTPYNAKTRKIIHDTIFYKSYSVDFIDSYLGNLFSELITLTYTSLPINFKFLFLSNTPFNSPVSVSI